MKINKCEKENPILGNNSSFFAFVGTFYSSSTLYFPCVFLFTSNKLLLARLTQLYGTLHKKTLCTFLHVKQFRFHISFSFLRYNFFAVVFCLVRDRCFSTFFYDAVHLKRIRRCFVCLFFAPLFGICCPLYRLYFGFFLFTVIIR